MDGEGRVAKPSRIASVDRADGKVTGINVGRAPSGRRELREEPSRRVIKEHRAGRHDRQTLAGRALRPSLDPSEEAKDRESRADRGDRVDNVGRSHRVVRGDIGQVVARAGTAARSRDVDGSPGWGGGRRSDAPTGFSP
jgi:hypothetical protein